MHDQDATENVRVALRHPVRREVLVRVVRQGRPVSAGDLAEQLGMPASNASYHARVLVQCGVLQLVDVRPDKGPIQYFYEPSALIEHPMIKAALESDDDEGNAAT
jgi:DNA-binding transcriptional ArsR family regulator